MGKWVADGRGEGADVWVVVDVTVRVGLEVRVAVGLALTVVSVGRVVTVGCNVEVGELVLEAIGVVVVGTVVLVGDGRANLIPPSESARRKMPATITHDNTAAMMPIPIPKIIRF